MSERKPVELPEVRQLSEIERSEARMKTAMQNKAHCLAWLEGTGRKYVIFRSDHLVESFVWPEHGRMLQILIAGYRDHRAAIEHHKDRDGLPVCFGETLEVEEIDRAIRYLIGEITAKDPTWKLENDPL